MSQAQQRFNNIHSCIHVWTLNISPNMFPGHAIKHNCLSFLQMRKVRNTQSQLKHWSFTWTTFSPGNALVCAWCSHIFQRRPVLLACREVKHTEFPVEAPRWEWLLRLSCTDWIPLDGSPSVWWWALAQCLGERTNWPKGRATETTSINMNHYLAFSSCQVHIYHIVMVSCEVTPPLKCVTDIIYHRNIPRGRQATDIRCKIQNDILQWLQVGKH